MKIKESIRSYQLLLFMFLAIGLFFSSCSNTKQSNQVILTPIWSDEFNYEGLPDTSKWSYDIGDGCPHLCGWGNNELQYYTDRKKNARVENGHLIIEAHKESMGQKKYTSTRLVSKHKGDWKYGRVEVRAKVPVGLGTWAAIWMLPTDNEYGIWPASGEIDIMEHVGYNPDTIFGTVHTQAFNGMIGTHIGKGLQVKNTEKDFHIYAVEWTQEKIDFFIDDQNYFTFENQKKSFEEFPFDQKFHLIMNIAIGGNWGGKMGINEDIFPQKMIVDYVKVYDQTYIAHRKLQSKK